MASARYFRCTHCPFTVEAWDEGNPYIVDYRGNRQHCYHPSTEEIIERVKAETGYDSPHQDFGRLGNEYDLLCLNCGAIARIDPDHDPLTCPECGRSDLLNVNEIESTPCPKCHEGIFEQDKERFVVS